ncbi:hypothetical protein MMC29_005263 [Sticta canariensis]|nr:hypothetical protein [Sticta canariensis]
MLQSMLVVVYDHWAITLRSVQASTGSGAVPKDRRRLLAWMAVALCLMILEGIVYGELLLRLQILIQSAFDHTVENLLWFVIALAISIAVLVDVAFCSIWLLEITRFLMEMMALSKFALHYSAARNGTTYQDPESGNLMSAPHSYTDETSSLLDRAAEGLPSLPGVLTAQDGDPNIPLGLAWVPRDEVMRKAIANATRKARASRKARATPAPVSPRPTSGSGSSLQAPLFRSTTAPTAASTSSSGSDFGPCYVDSESEDECTSEYSPKSAASAKSQPELQREFSHEEEFTILDRTMTL